MNEDALQWVGAGLRIKETRIGQWLKSKALHILETVGGYFTLRSLVDKRQPQP